MIETNIKDEKYDSRTTNIYNTSIYTICVYVLSANKEK